MFSAAHVIPQHHPPTPPCRVCGQQPFLLKSSKRGRHIEAYFRCSDCFHLSKGNRHKKADVFLFPILIFIFQFETQTSHFLPAKCEYVREPSESPKYSENDDSDVKSWCLLTRMSVRNVPSSPCVSFQVFSLGSYLGGAGKQECRCDTWIFLFHQQPPLKMLLLFGEIKSWKFLTLVKATNRFDFPCVRISHGSSVSQWVVIKDKWLPRGSHYNLKLMGFAMCVSIDPAIRGGPPH